MSKDALNQLRELLRAAVNHAEGDLTGEPLAMLAARVKTRVWLIVDRIARGLVGLLDDEIRSYQEKLHRCERRSPPVARHPRHARYVPNYRVWPITIVLDAARSRTSS